MLFCFWLIAILLFDASIVNAECVQSFDEAPGEIKTISTVHKSYKSCDYLIRAPPDCSITLNLTSFYGFRYAPASSNSATCRPGLRISEISTDSSSEAVMQVLCPGHLTLPTVYHSTSHLIKLTYVWLPKHSSRFNLHFYFRKKANLSPQPPPSQPSSSLSPTTPSSTGSSIQVVIVVLAVAIVFGFAACLVSHYKMGARSWSEQRHQRHQNHPLSPSSSSEVVSSAYQIHHSVNNPVSTVLYVSPPTRGISGNSGHESNMRLQNSLQHHLDANYPTSIALPDGEEIPYGSWNNFRLRNAEQQSEIVRECVKPPPNRTIFDGASPQPYRSKSVGSLNAKKGGRTPPPTLVRDEDRLPLVHCNTTGPSTRLQFGPAASSSVDRNHKNNSKTIVPINCHKSQSTVQPDDLITSPRHPATTTASRFPPTNQQTVIGQIDPPPNYSEVVANPSLYHSTATNRRHQNVL